MYELKRELKFLMQRPKFILNSKLSYEYFSEDILSEWVQLKEIVMNRALSPKDQIVIKLYFSFLGLDLENMSKRSTKEASETKFYDLLQECLSEEPLILAEKMFPEAHFKFDNSV